MSETTTETAAPFVPVDWPTFIRVVKDSDTAAKAADTLGISETLVQARINTLVKKGVPVKQFPKSRKGRKSRVDWNGLTQYANGLNAA